ncbi:MAG: HipA domain-containing protein [Saprospiraceae bacterium]
MGQLSRGKGLTGVQKKLSGDIVNSAPEEFTNIQSRMVLTDALSGYTIKPQTEEYPHLPENESLSLQLAEAVGLDIVPHTLLRTVQGELVYITRRIDRGANGATVQQEDMAQITERLTEEKYKGSYEQVGKAVKKYSDDWRLDLLSYYRSVLFCFCIGNVDAHLKNWSLHRPSKRWRLMPLYDLVSTRLVIPKSKDPDELCLRLAGRTHGFTLKNFQAFAKTIGLPETQADAQIKAILKSEDVMQQRISRSFLPEKMKEEFSELLSERCRRLEL